jgi:dihydroorotase
MKGILIKNARIVNEGSVKTLDVLIEGPFIKKIDSHIDQFPPNTRIIDAKNRYLIPGVIDDQVHFREPGLTHKADIGSESRAAVAGGITSFIEMPNTVPNATTQELLEDKFKIAQKVSLANYSFMIGGTNDNLEELLKTNGRDVAGIKLFLGSSTGDMLVDNQEALENIFSNTDLLIALHCEDETTIKNNLDKQKSIYGDDIPMNLHPVIRSEEACYLSSSNAVELAKRTGARIHVFHLSTAKETHLFTNKIPLEEKRITAEVCVHHLTFDDRDYDEKGSLIKWNPAIKSAKDKSGLWKALLDDRIDVIATDHAPHTQEEKNQVYTKAPSGGPLVQHALLVMMDAVREGKIGIEKMVEKMCHNPAILFRIEKRGFVREGYYADLVLIDPDLPQEVTKESLLYKCGWSPFEGRVFQSTVTHTFVNGNLVFKEGQLYEDAKGQRLLFNR